MQRLSCGVVLTAFSCFKAWCLALETGSVVLSAETSMSWSHVPGVFSICVVAGSLGFRRVKLEWTLSSMAAYPWSHQLPYVCSITSRIKFLLLESYACDSEKLCFCGYILGVSPSACTLIVCRILVLGSPIRVKAPICRLDWVSSTSIGEETWLKYGHPSALETSWIFE